MSPNQSKPLAQTDESSKKLIIEALAGNPTYGFDVDSIYYLSKENKWVVLEFLKCDHATVKPSESHPKRYWYNWRKFASLWRLAQDLNADLYLINYEDIEHAIAQERTEREFLVMKVLGMNPTSNGGITREDKRTYNFDGFQEWYQKLNKRGAP